MNIEEFGISGEWDQLYNRGTKDAGDHWLYGAHADRHYLQFETMRYAHNPENSAGGADDTITCGAFAATNPVASEGVLLVANVAHDFRVNWGLYPGFSATKMTACYSRTTTGLMIPC